MELQPKDITLNNGLKMPLVGLGTYLINDKDAIANAIVSAGYRHIDTAWVYDTEEIVGQAVKELIEKGEIKREDLFITSKMAHGDYADPE